MHIFRFVGSARALRRSEFRALCHEHRPKAQNELLRHGEISAQKGFRGGFSARKYSLAGKSRLFRRGRAFHGGPAQRGSGKALYGRRVRKKERKIRLSLQAVHQRIAHVPRDLRALLSGRGEDDKRFLDAQQKLGGLRRQRPFGESFVQLRQKRDMRPRRGRIFFVFFLECGAK